LTAKKVAHEMKLMGGLLFSIKDMTTRLTPRTLDESESAPLISFSTNEYKVHYLETLTGLRFILCTDTSVGRITDTLAGLYKLYVEWMVKNPISMVVGEGYGTNGDDTVAGLMCGGGVNGSGEIECAAFIEKVVAAIEQLPYFN